MDPSEKHTKLVRAILIGAHGGADGVDGVTVQQTAVAVSEIERVPVSIVLMKYNQMKIVPVREMMKNCVTKRLVNAK